MKASVGSILLVAFASSSAWGGTVTFTPNNAVFDVADQVGLATVEFDVAITDFDGALGTVDDVGEWFDAFDLLIGSNDGLVFEDFVFNPGVVGPNTGCWSFPYDCGQGPGPGVFYLSDFVLGLFFQATPAVLGETGFELGTLFVDASGLPVGTYRLTVDGDFDELHSAVALGGAIEPLFGSATVTITPEPGTLVLLGLASAASLPRRRRRGK